MRYCLALVWLAGSLAAAAQHATAWQDSLQTYWDRINAEYRDPAHSPLPTEARSHFTELERFAPDSTYRVWASFKEKPGETFGMKDRWSGARFEGILSYVLQHPRFGNAITAQLALTVPFEY